MGLSGLWVFQEWENESLIPGAAWVFSISQKSSFLGHFPPRSFSAPALPLPLLCSRSIKTANVAADTALRKKILIVYEGSHFKSKKILHIKWMELAKTKSFFPKKSCFKSKIRDKNKFTP